MCYTIGYINLDIGRYCKSFVIESDTRSWHGRTTKPLAEKYVLHEQTWPEYTVSIYLGNVTWASQSENSYNVNQGCAKANAQGQGLTR